MVFLSDIQKYIKTLKLAENVYIGRIDADKTNVIGIYNREKTTHKTIGGVKTYDITALSVLVHGSKSKSATEKFAKSVYDKLFTSAGKINSKNILFIDMLSDAPIDINQDAGEIYEYVIELNLYSER